MHRCAFSICSNNYLGQVGTLFELFRRFHPDFDLFLCLVDEASGSYGDYSLIQARDLGIDAFDSFSFQYNIMELNTAVKPFMFLKLFKELSYNQVIYLDPDIEIFRPLTTVLDALNQGASFVLTPHLLRPAENDAQPDDVAIMRAGTYNLGFLACSDQAETEPILRWWARRLRHQCVSDPDRGLFVDQKFIDLVPGFADHVRILRDPTLNVAYWNLQQRKLSRQGETWTVDGEPLKFFHFSGIDPDDTSLLSKHTRKFRGSDIGPPLQRLMDEYCAKVRALAVNAGPAAAYAYGRFASGTPIQPFVREMFRQRHVPWNGNPFENYEAFLHDAAVGTNDDSPAFMITNLMHYWWQRFPMLRSTFDLCSADGCRAYTEWFIKNAGHELGLDLRYLEPIAVRAGRLPVLLPNPVDLNNSPDITLVGYLRTASGIGEIGRQMLRALSSTTLSIEGYDVALNVLAARDDTSCRDALVTTSNGRVQILGINADQLPLVLEQIQSNRLADYRVAIPFWELEEFPEPWVSSFDNVNEIWAPTRFVQLALLRKVAKPVVYMPMNLTFHAPRDLGRRYFSLPEDRFLFFFSFDFLSYQERKNPRGLLAAFRRAFHKGGHRATLVLKTMNGEFKPEDLAALQEELADIKNVILIDKTMTRAENLALIAACDCVATLHRSEGLGLIVAEAMALGKPVISTDYSATTEFVTAATGFPVAHRLIPVEPGQYPFAAGMWADPDIDHAAWLMRRLCDDPQIATTKLAQARTLVAEKHGLRATADLYLARLRELGLVANDTWAKRLKRKVM